jgi:hypothetical protein
MPFEPLTSFELPINGLCGTICTLAVREDWIGSQIKTAVEKRQNIPVSEQRLMVNESLFKDATKLSEYPGLRDGSQHLTLIRHLPIKLPSNASPAEWVALYAYEHCQRPSVPGSLQAFAAHRGGNIKWADANQVVKLYKDPSEALAELPEPIQPIRPAAPQKRQTHTAGPEEVTVSVKYRTVDNFLDGACPICLQDNGDSEKVELLCGGSHRFHKDCIDDWLAGSAGKAGPAVYRLDGQLVQQPTGKQRRCPLCRGEAKGEVVASTSGCFKSIPKKTVADAAFGK